MAKSKRWFGHGQTSQTVEAAPSQNNAVFEGLAVVVKNNTVFQFSKQVLISVHCGLRSGQEGSDLGQVRSVQVTPRNVMASVS